MSGETKHGVGGKPSRALLILAFAAVYLVWGSTYLGIKYAIETLPPFLMAGVRFLIAGSILYLWARFKGAPRPSRIHWRTALVIGALLLVGGNGIVVWAESRVASSLAALLVAIEPLWVVLLNWTLPGNKRPGARVFVGLFIGFVGVWLLLGIGLTGNLAESGPIDLLGAGLVIVAAFSWAAGSIYSTRAPSPGSSILGSGMMMLVGGGLLVIVGTVMGEWQRLDLHHVTSRSLGGMIYLIIFGSFIGFTAYSWLLRVAAPTMVATYAYVNPAVAVFLGWWIAGEAVTKRTILGAAVIVASVVLITTARKPRAEQASDTTVELSPEGEACLIP